MWTAKPRIQGSAFTAIICSSTFAPPISAATCTVVRAGGSVEESLLVNLVKLAEIIETRDVHSHRRDVVVTHSRCIQDFTHIGEGLARFRFDSTRNDIVRFILSNRPAR
jgi:hypothetical protein